MLLTAKAGSVVASLKMAGADGAIGLTNQNTVWTDGLVSVMFDDVWFAREFGKKHGQQRWTGNVRDVCPPNQAPELKRRRSADDAEWEGVVIESIRGSFCRKDDIPFVAARLREMHFGELASEERNDRFDAAYAGSEEVGINQELHVYFSEETATTSEFERRREIAASTATTRASALACGDQVRILARAFVWMDARELGSCSASRIVFARTVVSPQG